MTEPPALVPPPEHTAHRWHIIEFPHGQGIEPKEWTGDHWRHAGIEISPEDAARSRWVYAGPCIPNAAARIAELEDEVKRVRSMVPDPENKETETRVMRAIWNAAHPIARFDEPDVGPGGNERATLTRQARAAIRALIGESHDN